MLHQPRADPQKNLPPKTPPSLCPQGASLYSGPNFLSPSTHSPSPSSEFSDLILMQIFLWERISFLNKTDCFNSYSPGHNCERELAEGQRGTRGELKIDRSGPEDLAQLVSPDGGRWARVGGSGEGSTGAGQKQCQHPTGRVLCPQGSGSRNSSTKERDVQGLSRGKVLSRVLDK